MVRVRAVPSGALHERLVSRNICCPDCSTSVDKDCVKGGIHSQRLEDRGGDRGRTTPVQGQREAEQPRLALPRSLRPARECTRDFG